MLKRPILDPLDLQKWLGLTEGGKHIPSFSDAQSFRYQYGVSYTLGNTISCASLRIDSIGQASSSSYRMASSRTIIPVSAGGEARLISKT